MISPAAVRTVRPSRTKRSVGVLAALALGGLSACGSHHHAPAAAPVATAPAPAPTSTSSSSTTTAPARHRRHRHRVVHHAPPPAISGPTAPLTGLPAAAGAASGPAVIVKIDNIEQALPQTGPNQADVVYEEMVEGGLTRLAAVFQSQRPSTVGPVRSGRLTDEGIADDLDRPVLAYEGANNLFLPQLAAQPVVNVDATIAPGLFVRDPGRLAPHNTYSDVVGLTSLDPTGGAPPRLWAFRSPGSPFAASGATPAAGVAISFPAASVRWTWSPSAHLWFRTQDGAADLDSTGVQLSASNIVVEAIPYITSAYVTGEGAGADGGPIPEGEMVGSGPAWFLSDGVIARGTWTRTSLTSTTSYRDGAGRPIALQPGRTWVELPPAGSTPSVTP